MGLKRSSRWRVRRFRHWIKSSLWVIPGAYAAVALGGGVGLVAFDHSAPITSPLDLSSASAGAALAALGGGMITFTGFVMSVVLLVVQFGSSQFSPRFLRWFRDDPVMKHSLGTFIATFVFALTATALSGRGPTDVVPYRALVGAMVLTAASIGWFLALISRTSDNLRVAHVIQRIDSQARRVFDTAYPASSVEIEAAEQAAASVDGRSAVQVLRHPGVGAILVSADWEELLQIAERHDALIELCAAVGDHVAADGLVIRVYGERELPARPLRGALLFGDERTVEDDPAFTLRLLVDVAIKALSPAVNDPTTAVQCLHRIEDVLRYAAAKHLASGVVTGGDGAVRVLVPVPTWDDLVTLALDEIRAFGAGQYQVARRVRALLLDLLADLPERRHAELINQLALLDDAITRAIPAGQRAHALIADRQGLGLAVRADD